MKHFQLTRAPSTRNFKFILITNEGYEFEPFSIAIRNMTRQGYSSNTIEQYSGHIARFIDYIYEAAEHIPDLTAESILDIVYSYRGFLLFGANSEDALTKKIALQLRPSRVTSGSSLPTINAALQYFLTLSDTKALNEGQGTLFDKVSLPKNRKLTNEEQSAIKRKSMLAGVIRGGAKLISDRHGILGRPPRVADNQHAREAMPFDKVGELISCARSYRDKAFYSLLAASGCRQHEALQVHLSDVNFEKRSVVLKDPFKRDIFDLSESEYQKLGWKGRATPTTFLIEPFKSSFFEYLEKYIRHERIAHGLNDYLFQKKDGRPYFTATRQSRTDTFKKLRDRIGLKGKNSITPHSIRHMYGTYTLNYLPLQDRFGLPLAIVRLLMGHSSITSTEIYAKQDEDMAMTHIEYANQMVYELEGSLSIDEIKVLYHKREIAKVMSLEEETVVHRGNPDDQLNT